MSEKTAAMSDFKTQISGDKDLWIDEAIKKMLEKDPRLQGAEANVEIQFADEDELNGFGYIVARRGEVVMQIPFYVRDGEMEKLDLIVIGGVKYPWTEDRINEFLFEQSAYGSVSREPALGSLMPEANGISTPERFKMASDQSSLLDRVLPLVSDNEIKECIASIDEGVIAGLSKRGQLHLFDKMAERVEAPAPVNALAWVIDLQAPGHYKVACYTDPSAAKPEYERTLVGADGPEFFAKLGHTKVLDRVDAAGGHLVLSHRPAAVQPVLGGAKKEASERSVEKVAGYATVGIANGEMDQGISFQVCSLRGVSRGYLFLGEKVAARAEQIPGISTERTDIELQAFKFEPGSREKKATLGWTEDGAFRCLEPFTVKSVVREGGVLRKMATEDGMGHPIDWVFDDQVDAICPAEKLASTGGTPVYYAPLRYSLLEVGPYQEVVTPDQWMDITLEKNAEYAQGQVLDVLYDGKYHFHVAANRPAESVKIAGRKQFLSRGEMEVKLACLGVDEVRSKGILQAVESDGRTTVYGLGLPKYPESTKLAYDRAAVGRAIASVEAIRPQLWKWAAETGGEEWMTDRMVGMQFMAERTIEEFVEDLPQIEEVVMMLAEMLDQARTEKIDIVPEILSQAMISLDEVAQNLRALSAEKPLVEE